MGEYAVDQKRKELMSYCRQCGGERHHSVIAEETRSWDEDDSPVSGSETWSIVECAGCHTVTFVHSHWFSEDEEYTEDGPRPIVHRHLYPPTASRKMPEWEERDIYDSGLNPDGLWIVKVHDDIYASIGIGAYELAAMGTRAIVDFVVTSKAGKKGCFIDKLNRLNSQNLITETQVNVIYAAFDAGSAAAHRGHSPPQADVYTQLEIAESLVQQIYIDPVRQSRLAKAATALKSRTPQRPK